MGRGRTCIAKAGQLQNQYATKPKSHQLPKEPRRDLTLSVLRPFFSYRQIFQRFWTNASHYSSSPEGVETVLLHFLARFDRSFSTDSTAIVQRGR